MKRAKYLLCGLLVVLVLISCDFMRRDSLDFDTSSGELKIEKSDYVITSIHIALASSEKNIVSISRVGNPADAFMNIYAPSKKYRSKAIFPLLKDSSYVMTIYLQPSTVQNGKSSDLDLTCMFHFKLNSGIKEM